MDREKYVDEGWKDSVTKEKVAEEAPGQDAKGPRDEGRGAKSPEVNFFNYLTSLAFQAMVFLGEVENPVTERYEKNLPQAKLLIDTLTMLRDKTKSNLTKEEDNMLNGAIYELQVKYVEHFKTGKP